MYQRQIEDLDRAMEDLANSLEALSDVDYGYRRGSLAEEALVLLRGTPAQVVEFWESQPKEYFDSEQGDLLRRRLVLRQQRAELWEPMNALCHPMWALDDVFRLDPGPSELRARLLVLPHDQLVPVGDVDVCVWPESTKDIIEPHRLSIAIAMGDPLSGAAVEATPALMDGLSQEARAMLRGEAALVLMGSARTPERFEFARQQWLKAVEEGWIMERGDLDELAQLISYALSRGNGPAHSTVLFVRAADALDTRKPIEAQAARAEALAEMVWKMTPELAVQVWASCIQKDPRLIDFGRPERSPFFTTVEEKDDLFLTLLRDGTYVSGERLFSTCADAPPAELFSRETVQRWIEAAVKPIMHSGSTYWPGSLDVALHRVQKWLDGETGAPWPSSRLDDQTNEFLSRWTSECFDAMAGLMAFKDTPAIKEGAPEWRQALLRMRMLGTFDPAPDRPRPRF